MHTSLSKLMPEIIIQIFKSAENLDTATSLSSTSYKFNAIWKENAGSICSLILPRGVPHLVKAQELIDTQLGDIEENATGQGFYEQVIQRVGLLFQNKRLAHLAMKFDVKKVESGKSRFSSSVYVPAYY